MSDLERRAAAIADLCARALDFGATPLEAAFLFTDDETVAELNAHVARQAGPDQCIVLSRRHVACHRRRSPRPLGDVALAFGVVSREARSKASRSRSYEPPHRPWTAASCRLRPYERRAKRDAWKRARRAFSPEWALPIPIASARRAHEHALHREAAGSAHRPRRPVGLLKRVSGRRATARLKRACKMSSIRTRGQRWRIAHCG